MTSSSVFPRIVAATAVVVLLILAVGSTVLIGLRLYERGGASRNAPTPFVAVEQQQPPEHSIAAEAAAWHSAPPSFATDPRTNRAPRAHPRTLATWRMRRAFPGAPPRIPHGLTPQEFLTASCNTCHQRGGYSQRFGAYAPVTPHAELQPCTQCHVSDAAVIGIDLPGVTASPDAACRQCHFPATAPARSVAADSATSTWPRFAKSAPGNAPPVIPHEVWFRGNCQACHVGPGAVLEIRTAHPERLNCRQCHVESAVEGGVR